MKFGKIDFNYSGFDWDKGNRNKIGSRIPIAVVEELFKQELLIKKDVKHSIYEERLIAIGYIPNSRKCIVVIFTIRFKENEILIRPISARYTHEKEEKAYEREVQKIKESQR